MKNEQRHFQTTFQPASLKRAEGLSRYLRRLLFPGSLQPPRVGRRSGIVALVLFASLSLAAQPVSFPTPIYYGVYVVDESNKKIIGCIDQLAVNTSQRYQSSVFKIIRKIDPATGQADLVDAQAFNVPSAVTFAAFFKNDAYKTLRGLTLTGWFFVRNVVTSSGATVAVNAWLSGMPTALTLLTPSSYDTFLIRPVQDSTDLLLAETVPNPLPVGLYSVAGSWISVGRPPEVQTSACVDGHAVPTSFFPDYYYQFAKCQ
jgi:hypothetical protein